MPKREPTKVVRIPVALYGLFSRITDAHKSGNKALVDNLYVMVAQDAITNSVNTQKIT